MEKITSTKIFLHCKLHEYLEIMDICKFCSLEVKGENLEKHLKSHRLFLEPVISKNLSEFVSKSFKEDDGTRKSVIMGMKSDTIVGKIPVFQCQICKKLFLGEEDLDIHSKKNACARHEEKCKNQLESIPKTHSKLQKPTPISYKPVEVFKKPDNSYTVGVRGFEVYFSENEPNFDSETLICCLCLKKIDTSHLVPHVKSHNPLKTSDDCKICSTKCNSINELKKHLSKHSFFLDGIPCHNFVEFEEKRFALKTKIYLQGKSDESESENLPYKIPVFTCTNCSKICLDHKDLITHMKEHNLDKTISKDIPVTSSNSVPEILKEASGEIKVILNGFSVRLSDFENENDGINSLLFNNIELLLKNPIYTCCICLEDVSSTNVASHCGSHYPLKDTDYCKTCSLHFETTANLEEHLTIHKLVLDTILCKTLNDFSEKIERIDREISLSDMSYYIPAFECELCGKIILVESIFKQHSESSNCISFVQPIEFFGEKEVDMKLVIYGYSLKSRSEGDIDDSLPEIDNSYICCICLEVFKSKNDIPSHYKSHFPLKVTDACKMCSFRSDSIDVLERHIRKHSVFLNDMDLAAVVNASDAGKQIEIQSNSLNTDETQVTNDDSAQDDSTRHCLLRCFVCEIVFTSETLFKNHLKSGNCLKLKAFTCKRCGKNFSKRRQLTYHMNSSHSSIYSLCHICGSNIKTIGMRRHIRTMHEKRESILLQENLNKVVCDVCGVSVNKYVFDRHFATHSFNRNFICNTCNKTFTHEISYKTHMKTHGSERPYSCEICSDTFKRRDHVVNHKARIHNIIRTKDYKCDVCKKHFSTPNTLRLHKRTHLESQNYECLECKAIFSAETGLKNHQTQTRHEGVKFNPLAIDKRHKVNRFVCKICGQRYGSITSLKRHETIHDGSNENEDSAITYECPECHRNYSSQRSLELHIIRTNHAADRTRWKRKVKKPEIELTFSKRQFVCDMCDSRFLKRYNLKVHRKKLKHFIVCKVCNDTTVVDLEEHDKEMHPPSTDDNRFTITYNCAECPRKFKKLKMLDNHIATKHTIITNTQTPPKCGDTRIPTECEETPISNIIVKAIKTIPLSVDKYIVL